LKVMMTCYNRVYAAVHRARLSITSTAAGSTSGLAGVEFALTDMPPGTGGFCVVPGSHKANFELPFEDLNEFAEPLPVAAGDVILTTPPENGGRLPTSCHRRIGRQLEGGGRSVRARGAWRRRALMVILSWSLFLTACRTDGAGDASGAGAVPPEVAGRYDAVAGAVREILGPYCGGDPGYIEQPRAATDSAEGAPHRQFLDARVYELSPCRLPPGQRSQLRIARFATAEARDAAIAANMARSLRPATSWQYHDTFSVELWLLDTSSDAEVAAALAAAHDAVRVLPGMRVVLDR
jgi:hypothetical protein